MQPSVFLSPKNWLDEMTAKVWTKILLLARSGSPRYRHKVKVILYNLWMKKCLDSSAIPICIEWDWQLGTLASLIRTAFCVIRCLKKGLELSLLWKMPLRKFVLVLAGFLFQNWWPILFFEELPLTKWKEIFLRKCKKRWNDLTEMLKKERA